MNRGGPPSSGEGQDFAALLRGEAQAEAGGSGQAPAADGRNERTAADHATGKESAQAAESAVGSRPIEISAAEGTAADFPADPMHPDDAGISEVDADTPLTAEDGLAEDRADLLSGLGIPAFSPPPETVMSAPAAAGRPEAGVPAGEGLPATAVPVDTATLLPGAVAANATEKLLPTGGIVPEALSGVVPAGVPTGISPSASLPNTGAAMPQPGAPPVVSAHQAPAQPPMLATDTATLPTARVESAAAEEALLAATNRIIDAAANAAVPVAVTAGTDGLVASPPMSRLEGLAGVAGAPTLTSGMSPGSAPAATLDTQDKAWMPQLASDLLQIREQGDSRMRINLAPAHLGMIDCEITETARGIELRVITESGAARDLMQDNNQDLRQRFQEAGLTLAGFHCESDSRGANANGSETGPVATSGLIAEGDENLAPTMPLSAAAVRLLDLYA